MITLWPLVIVLAVGTVLFAVFLAGRGLFAATRATVRTFWCPFEEQDVSVEFQEAVWDGRRVDVDRCTCFHPATAVTCAKGCVRLERLPTVRGRTTRHRCRRPECEPSSLAS